MSFVVGSLLGVRSDGRIPGSSAPYENVAKSAAAENEERPERKPVVRLPRRDGDSVRLRFLARGWEDFHDLGVQSGWSRCHDQVRLNALSRIPPHSKAPSNRGRIRFGRPDLVVFRLFWRGGCEVG